MKNLKKKILILLSVMTCVCVAIGGLNLNVEKIAKAQEESTITLSGGEDLNRNLFQQATISDTNYIYNQCATAGTVGDYIKVGGYQKIGSISQYPVPTSNVAEAVSYAGAKVTLTGTTTMDMGIVDLSNSKATDTNAVIGFLPTVNYTGPKTASKVTNPILGVYYTFRSTVNPDKYFDIAMIETNAANWKYPSIGVAFNGSNLHYGQTVNPENSSIPAGRVYAIEENSRVGSYAYRFDGSVITSSESAASTSHGRVWDQKKYPDGSYSDHISDYNYPAQIYYDQETSKFYLATMEYQVLSKMKGNRDTYIVTADDNSERYLLLDASKAIGSYSGDSAYNDTYGWKGFTEEEAKSVAVTMYVDWNPAYEGTHDIVITDFAGQKVNTETANMLKANRGTAGVLKRFTGSNGIATLSNGYSVNLSDNDVFTKLVSFEVYPEQLGKAKATNNSGLFEVAFTLSDGTNNLKINMKDFNEGSTYRNCVTVSANGEAKWALNQSGTFQQNTEYGYPLPYHFDKYIRYVNEWWALDQFSAYEADGDVAEEWTNKGIRTDVNATTHATFNIYYNAKDNCLYADAGYRDTGLCTVFEKSDGTKVKRWKIADLSGTYNGAREAFAGFGNNNLSFSMATTLVNGFDSAVIRILEVDGQKFATDPFADTYLDPLADGLKGETYEFATPSDVSSFGAHELSLVSPSGQDIYVSNDKFVPTETGEYQAIYMVGSARFITSFHVYDMAINADALAGNFTKIGDNISYIKDISYGEFTADYFSGGGLMVTTRNKLPEYVNVTDTSNTTNPWLINYGSRTPLGVEYNNAVNIADNTKSDTLIELAFPAPDGTNNYKFHQNKAYKVIIADVENPDKYIAVYFWNAYYSGGSGDNKGGDDRMYMRVGAIASWETESGEHSGLIGYDDGTTFTQVDKEQGGGVSLVAVTFAGDSDDTVRVSFDYETGKLYANGKLIRSFKDVSANGAKFFEGFADGKAKLSVSVQRSNKYSTDEWTRFCIMTLDGVSLLAKKGGKFDGKILDDTLGLKPYVQLVDTTTGTTLHFDENSVVNVGALFSGETNKVIGYYEDGNLKNVKDLNSLTLEESKEYELVYLDFYTEEGASIRKTGKTGLRFKGFVSNSVNSALEGKIIEYGMIFAPTDYIENKAFTLDDYKEGKMYKQVATEYVEDGDFNKFYVTMININAENFAREFSARVYVKINYDGGEDYVYSSYNVEDNSRSAYEIAKSAYNNAKEYEGYDDETKQAIEKHFKKYLNSVIEVNSLGVKANDDADYTIANVLNNGTTLSFTVSGASGARCLVYDGAAYWHNGSTLIMEDSGDKLNVTFTLPTRMTSVSAQAVNIIDNGNTEYSILVPENATQSELFAAQELQTIMFDTYGAEMPIVSSYDNSTSKYISLGNTDFKKASGLTLSSYTKNQGGFGIKSFGEGVAIYAEDDYALFFGMYRFLEKNFGYKYYTYDCFVIDKNQTQELAYFNYEDYPDIRYRSVHSELSRVGYRSEHSDVLPATDIDENMKAAYINMHQYSTGSAYQYIQGDGYSSGNYGHNIIPFGYGLDDQSLLTYLLPYDSSWDYYDTGKAYGADHPDWYYRESGEVKQICFTKALSDELMYNTILERLIGVINKRTSKVFFEIGIGDNSSKCTCSNCNSAYNTYGESGVYLRLVNKLANDVKIWQAKNCPRREIYLMAYAYQAFIEPPKGVVAADNVIVRIAPITLDYAKAITASNNYYDDSWFNRVTWTTIFEGWKNAAVHLGIWDYRADFRIYVQPLPLQKSTEANIEYYKQIGVKEVFSQGISGSDKYSIYPFAEMDDWIRLRMYWDTTLSYNNLRNEFVNAYYGNAANYVLQYISKIESAFGSTEFDLGEDMSVSQLKKRYSDSWVSEVQTIFTNAYNAVSDDAQITRRLDYLSIFYRYLQIKCSYTGADKATFKTMCASLGIFKVEIGLTVEDFTA